MKKIDEIWEKIEKTAVYAILSIFIVGQLLALFFPKLAQFMDSRGSLLMIAIVLLAIFRYIDKNIGQLDKNEITKVTKFTTDILSTLKKKQYKEVKILANSSYKYYHAISESDIKIKSLKLLVRDYSDIQQIQFPTDEKAREDFAFSSNQLLNNWKILKEKGKIESLEIYFYPFDSILHFMIVDDEILHFGLLKPIHHFPGSDLNGSYIIDNNSKNGKEFLKSFILEFDTICNDFSTPEGKEDTETES